MALFFYVRKATLKKRYKLFIFTTACLFIAWAVTLSSQNSVRPNLSSTLLVGKKVFVNDGVFGVGPGNFARAWQLYRPQDVINSAYFGYDFNQGADTMTTFLVSLGVIGFIAFMFLTLSALYSTFVSYRQSKDGQDHFILGLLFFALLYFFSVSWLVPLYHMQCWLCGWWLVVLVLLKLI